MEYVYATLLLNAAGKEVSQANIKKVIESAGLTVEDAKIKALLAALEGVDIKEVISKSASVSVAAPSGASASSTEAKKEEEPEEEEVSTEEAAAGLGALFG